MAKKYKSSFKSAAAGYKSKNRDRKRRGADIGSFLSASIGLAGSLLPSSSKKRRKSSSSKKKTYTKSSPSSRTNSSTKTTASESLTFEDFKYLLILGAFIFLALTTSFITAIIVTVVVVVIVLVVKVVKKRDEEKQNPHISCSLSQAEIDELQRHLANIDVYKDVANNSSDAYAVQCAMDELLKSIDFIMSYDEEDLHVAGMSKSKLPAQRDFIIQHYNDMVEQARERFAENNRETVGADNGAQQLNGSLSQNQREKQEAVPSVIAQGDIPSLETRLKISTPSNQGLYPHEILMLSYAHTYKLAENKFQGFWYYLYSVIDPQSVLISLYEREFLTAGDLRTAIERLKVSDLKEELQLVGAKTTGKKAELVNRLMEVGDTQALEQKYPDRYFVLTEKGQRELDENEYVMYLHRLKYMPVWDMNYLLNHDNPSHLGYRDMLWREFNIQSCEHFKTGNFGLYRNTRLYMYHFLMEENKHKTAFTTLCEVVAYDLSSLGNNERLDHDPVIEKFMLEQTLKLGFPYSNSLYKIPPAIIEWMSDMKGILQLSEAEFRAALLENFEQVSLRRRIFTNEECVEVVMNEIDNHPRNQTALYKQAEERLRAELESMA